MAKILAQNFSIDLSQVVSNAVKAVKSVRKKEQARREAEFQRAIADGLSYKEQLKLRQRFMDDEKNSSFPDEEYMAALEKSISDTKKLVRFDNYRQKYAAALKELAAGKKNEEKFLEELEGQLEGVTDPELRLEIQGDILDATKQVKTYHDTINANQVAFAQKDGTVPVLTDTIERISAARANAALDENEDEVTAYDATLLALNSQLNKVRVENSVNEYQAKSATLGASPIEKLNFFNSQIEKADANNPFRVGEKSYNSARAFWESQRDQYLAGESEMLGGNFFSEIQDFTDGQVQGSNARFGYTTQQALFDVLNQYNQLSGRPEMAPFIANLDTAKSGTLNGIVLPDVNTVTPPSTTVAPANPNAQRVVPATTTAPGAQNPTPEPTPTETPASTPTPGEVPAAPTQPDGTPQNPYPGQPLQTPASGVGTKSADGKFIFTEQGWKPTPEGAAGTPDAPQYTPAGGEGTLSNDGKWIYRNNKGWEPVTAFTQTSKVSLPEAKPVALPAAAVMAIPKADPLKIASVGSAPAAPVAPNYSPATGYGTKSPDNKFIFTKKGWEPILKPLDIPAPNLPNIANALEGARALFGFGGKKEEPVATPAAPTTPTPAPALATAPTREHVVAAGDTLGAIAKKYGKDVNQLAKDNKIADPNKIRVGQKIMY